MDRIILHMDMNSYFASVEQQANPFLRGKAIGVTGKRQERSVVAAASVEAKKFGIKTGMSAWEARRICPQLLLIAGDPEKYSEIMHRFNAILQEYTHLVEPFSVDESFADITDVAKDYFGAVFIAQSVRTRIKETCGDWITASIGVGPNKLIAKLASEQVKPNGLTVVRPRDVTLLLNSVDLQEVCGIGPHICAQLEKLGICNLEQLRSYPIALLVETFKSYGYWLHNAAHGRGDEVAVQYEDDQKSMGHSYTLPSDTWDPLEIKNYLLALADKVAWRLRRDGFAARRVRLHVRFSDFTSFNKQKQFAEPLSDGLKLFRIAWNMLPTFSKSIRLVGISASSLTHGYEQPSLFPREKKNAAALCAFDQLTRRYGTDVWTRASLLCTLIKPRSSGFHFDQT